LSLDSDGDDVNWLLFNNLFYGRSLYYRERGEDPVLLAKDNMFHQVAITKGGGSESFTHDYNGYVTNQNRLTPNGANDVILTNTDYKVGPLGNYYYPTNGGMLSRLINAGSASNA